MVSCSAIKIVIHSISIAANSIVDTFRVLMQVLAILFILKSALAIVFRLFLPTVDTSAFVQVCRQLC